MILRWDVRACAEEGSSTDDAFVPSRDDRSLCRMVASEARDGLNSHDEGETILVGQGDGAKRARVDHGKRRWKRSNMAFEASYEYGVQYVVRWMSLVGTNGADWRSTLEEHTDG
jgi:hypothetical protein